MSPPTLQASLFLHGLLKPALPIFRHNYNHKRGLICYSDFEFVFFLFFMHYFSLLNKIRPLWQKFVSQNSGIWNIQDQSAKCNMGQRYLQKQHPSGALGRWKEWKGRSWWLLIASILRGFFPLALMMELNSEDLTSWNYYICKEMPANNSQDDIPTMANTLPQSLLLHLCLLLSGKTHPDPLLLFLILFPSFLTGEGLSPCCLEA